MAKIAAGNSLATRVLMAVRDSTSEGYKLGGVHRLYRPPMKGLLGMKLLDRG